MKDEEEMEERKIEADEDVMHSMQACIMLMLHRHSGVMLVH